MARTLFAVVLASALIAGAFAGIFSSSSDSSTNQNMDNNNYNSQDDRAEDQLRRTHQRRDQQQIQKCTCEQQKTYFNEMKNVQRQCLEQCVRSESQYQPQTQWDNQEEQQKALETLRQCTTNQDYQRQQEEAIDCVDQKTQEQQQSCTKESNGEQIRNQDSSKKFADVLERASNKVRQQIEETYEQQKNGRDQKFGRALANQAYDCTYKCVVQKARQMDNAQKFNCEFQMDKEQLKQTVGQCHEKHIRRSLESVTKCAVEKGQQGAEQIQQEITQKNFNTEKLLQQQY
jgi:hypothetical protein